MYFLLPESPRFLLEVRISYISNDCEDYNTFSLQIGKQEKAMKALRLAYRMNRFCMTETKEYPVSS